MEKMNLLQLAMNVLLASQGMFYWLGLSRALDRVPVPVFAIQRKAVDDVLARRLKWLYLSTLVVGAGTVWLAMTDANIRGVWIFSLAALLLTAVDMVLAMACSMPVNRAFRDYSAGAEDARYRELQVKWLTLIRWRGLFAILAMLCSFTGLLYPCLF